MDPHCRQVVTAMGAAVLCVPLLLASNGGGDGSAAVGWCCRDAPHWSQNLALSGSRAPQLWQNTPLPLLPARNQRARPHISRHSTNSARRRLLALRRGTHWSRQGTLGHPCQERVSSDVVPGGSPGMP